MSSFDPLGVGTPLTNGMETASLPFHSASHFSACKIVSLFALKGGG